MKLDSAFVKEVNALNGNGSREAKFATLSQVRNAAADLSTPDVMDGAFDDAMQKYGRAVVGLCVAATILHRVDRYEHKHIHWAENVCDLWTNRGSSFDDAAFNDGLHPSRLLVYAGPLMALTTTE